MNWTTFKYPTYKHSCCPTVGGVYKFYTDSEILYIGLAKSIQVRLISHNAFLKKLFVSYPDLSIAFFQTNNYVELEKELIQTLNPKYNSINNSKRRKILDSIGTQINVAMDGRKLRWLSMEAKIPECDLTRKMKGMLNFSENELQRIETRLKFKIDRTA